MTAREKNELRRREIALLRANAQMEMVNRLENADAPRAVRRELLASVGRLLRVASGEGPVDEGDDFHRAVVKRGVRAAGLAAPGGSGAPGMLTGYAAVFNSRSVDLGGYVEFVKPGAFARTLGGGGDVKLLNDHNSGSVLASTSAGTLRLWEDERGLAFEANLGEARQYANDIAETVRRGELSKMSFGFYIRDDDWREEGGGMVRTLTDVELFEISAVAFPAYPATWVRPGTGAAYGRAAGGKGGNGSTWATRAAARRREIELLQLGR